MLNNPSLTLPAPAKLPPPPPPPLTSDHLHRRLISQINVGHLPKAISTLDLMARRGSHPDLPTYSLLLKSCLRSRRFHLAKLVHAHLSRSHLRPDSLILNSLISVYSKSGDFETARSIFQTMGPKRNLVSWSAMVSCFANNDIPLEAISMFVDMIEEGYNANEFCYASVIRACSNPELVGIGRVVFGMVVKTGYLESDVCIGSSLIDMFAKGSGELGDAYKVFEKMAETDAVTWSLMITRFVQMGYPRKAVELFMEMLSNGLMPDQFTLSGVVSACTKLGSLALGKQLHSWAERSRLVLDHCVGCCLVDMYAKCGGDGSMSDSRKVFDRMREHSVVSWTAVITGYVQSGGGDEEAVELFVKMISGGHVSPNHFTFASILKACANLSDRHKGGQVHSLAVKLGLASVNCVGNSLISMYARSGHVDDARKAFDVLYEKNLISYNAIVDAYAKHLDTEGAFGLLHEIENTGLGASAFTFASLLSGAASLCAVDKGEQIHSRIIKSGFESNQSICNALVSMYSRCGNINAAFQVFNKMEDWNVISWTSMITGFAKHGYAARAVGLFDQMLEAGLKPNEITYIAVLSACSHAGLISEGWKHFKEMHQQHGIVPRMEHYACMVDLLGRSGSLVEAIEFINSMPFEADALIWRTFLGACRVHCDVELGKHAAKMIMKQNPHDSAAYSLLSNLYASTGQWEEVANIRKQMKEKALVKEAGSSWIEVKNKMHKFHVGDTSHPKAQEIYDEMDRLGSKIKKLGYVPDTDYVLHEVDEEQKEYYLFQHSEKLAVTFGLISTSKSKPIRVFKNLRVCGDCHTAIKYISKATGREIVVRDSNRFHQFMDGTCSCNDYW
ncbi:PREDICTED: pentatricopeptide repeat-containing protein At3g49170, chloroplastic [Fragaria vesca subsp. vesca]|uniref:pentatricopeptide repeat-containing protein At3g49170, chloroplastic n=1 Tax=Fragaria vesca subsp. vesca TaxID=101020 RepID=UPI0002C2EEB9|nr:PREDICTED: pentatricopeptide repeat-containing protein At3g49170, chloroplastic [Fragaria vesca subsp. vesca]XP_011467848.1 PREDICTED: pentatricopeptide repeat-containing protein At3g49170, chloroplastic [Fragaria vesca subsp. vesca]